MSLKLGLVFPVLMSSFYLYIYYFVREFISLLNVRLVSLDYSQFGVLMKGQSTTSNYYSSAIK